METLLAGGGSALGYIIPFLIVLTVIVFVHEMGHFLVARWCGVAVETFSIGFGTELIGWNDKKGTRWKISVLPLGGYVKFVGDQGSASVPDKEHLAEISRHASEMGVRPEDCFHFKPLWQRAAVVAAGPIANFLLAILIFTGFLSIFGEMVRAPVVGQVMEDTPAARAGFEPGDRITAIDGREIERFAELQVLISMSADSERVVTVLRDGQEMELIVTPARVESQDAFGNKQKVGQLGIIVSIDPADVVHQDYSVPAALWQGVVRTGFMVQQTFHYIGRIFAGKEDAKQLGGPLKIAQYSGQAAKLGVISVISMIAMLSISIGLLNLFPIPMLDGGHLLFYGFEALKGEPLSERVQEVGFRIGLSLLLFLMIFVTWNDLSSFGVFKGISNLFS
ncbi:MAG: RIP metalloprotease RseP [Alphaproteobacteria bacterium]|nr:MAG: RIP metalloprotease RseP [Alphaproteobacteria bacterium]